MTSLEKALQRKHGGDHGNQYTGGKSNIVTLATQPKGNERAKALRRLRKDRPDLHEQVLEKKLSPHAAMVEAGFRPKTITVPIDINKAAAQTIPNQHLRTLSREPRKPQ